MSFLTPTENFYTTNSEMAVKKEALRVLPQPFAHFRSTVVSSTINMKATTSGSKTKEERKKNAFVAITRGGIKKHRSLLFTESLGRNHVGNVQKL